MRELNDPLMKKFGKKITKKLAEQINRRCLNDLKMILPRIKKEHNEIKGGGKSERD